MFDPKDPAHSFLKGCPFAVPAYIVEPKLDELKKNKRRPRLVAARVNDYVFDAYVFRPRPDLGYDHELGFSVDTIMIGVSLGFKFKDDFDVETCTVGDKLVPLFTRVGQAVIHPDKDATEITRRAIAAYQPLLCRFARLTGLVPHVHLEGGEIWSPLPETPGEAHIFPNARPPGEARTRFVYAVDDIPVYDNGREVVAHEPAAGRGLTLGDTAGTLVQTIGNNIYLLLPTLSNFDPQTSPKVFEYLLTLGWEGCKRHQIRPPEANRPARRKDFVATTKDWLETGQGLLAKDLANVNGNIEQAQRWLAELQRSKRDIEDHLRAYKEAPFVREKMAQLPREYRLIKKHPDVAMVAIVSEGIHVETKPLHIEHEGRTYAIGWFIIRIGRKGPVSVWCEFPLHPKGVPHPHIAKDGGPCFGNATQAIIQAGADHRYYDVVSMVLRWLRYGYTPQLAAAKIEEWPVAAEAPKPESDKDGGETGGGR